MASHSGPNIIEDGLVFCYDMGNTVKSWKGKPTTNYITDPTKEVIATASEFAVFENISPIFDTYGEGVYSISADIKSEVPGDITVYTASGAVEYNIGYYTAACETYYKRFYFNGINVTRTDPNVNVSNLSFYGVYGTGKKPSIKNVQVEKNAFCTPFVVGTRSNTQAILDLTGNNTVTATSLTYNSDGTFEFNGSSDLLDLGSDVVFKSTGGWTVDSWVKYDVVPDVYNNTTVPGNFIGAGTITHNSWYWSVYTKRLALWNRSPGIWKYGSTILQPNVWYNATLVCADSGTSYQMYLNGVAEGGDHVSYSWNASYAGLNIRYIGYGNASNPRRVDGKIAMTKVYNRALTAVEVARNFEANRRRFGI